MSENIFWHVSGKSWSINPLFLKYREQLKIYKLKITDKTLSNQEVYDFIVSLHFILEYQINNFFREWMIFFFPHSLYSGEIQVNNIKSIDHVSFIDKVTMLMYFFPCEWVVLSSFRNKIRNFSIKRNQIFHGWDVESVYTLEDWSLPEWDAILNKWKSEHYTIKDCEKQLKSYEDILLGLKEVFLNSPIWKNHVDRKEILLKSIFD